MPNQLSDKITTDMKGFLSSFQVAECEMIKVQLRAVSVCSIPVWVVFFM